MGATLAPWHGQECGVDHTAAAREGPFRDGPVLRFMAQAVLPLERHSAARRSRTMEALVMAMKPLTLGMTGVEARERQADVRALQTALNQRSRARGLDTITVDGEYGPATDRAVKRVARALGALEATIAKPGASVGEQRIIRWPLTRSPAQYARAAGRKRKAPPAIGAQKALAWARQWIGKTEDPPGSNRAPWGLTAWQQAFGSWLVGQAWCGVLCGTALVNAGVKAVNSRVAGVVLILEDALNGRNGRQAGRSRRPVRRGHARRDDRTPRPRRVADDRGEHVAGRRRIAERGRRMLPPHPA